MPRRVTFIALALSLICVNVAAFAADTTEFVIVEAGAPAAVVVLPEKAIATQQWAAQELIYHIRKSTGAELPLHREDSIPADARYVIYIGPCKAAAAAGIDAEALTPSEHVVKVVGNAMFLVGKDRSRVEAKDDDHWRYIANRWAGSWDGTMYAVYDFLQTDMGVKWVFPGELGEQIPHKTDIKVGKLDRSGKPRLVMSYAHPAGKKYYLASAWGSPRAHDQFHQAQSIFLIRHGMGSPVESIFYGHAFQKYWKRFGETNPEFFNLLPDGTRRPIDANRPHDVTMCVSEPKFWARVIKDWKNDPQRDPNHIPHRPYVNACENDTPGLCTCERCRAWDDANDPGFKNTDYWGKGIIPPNSKRFTIARVGWGELDDGSGGSGAAPSLSNRYARYYIELLKEARKVDPQAQVAGYAYANYWKAPTVELDLKGVMILYVPPAFFPLTEQDIADCNANWDGWRKLGARMVLRPNLTHAGANLPISYARPLAKIFSHAAANGMEATSFDSLLGAWSAQGPTLYTLIRMHQKPEMPVDEILDEYYSGFGPAKEGVKAYFEHWERHSNALDAREVTRFNGEEKGGGFKNYVRVAHRLFSPKDFAQARALLAAARRQAAGDQRALRQVAYLELGLTDAELTTATRAAQAKLEKQDSPANKAEFTKAFQKMIAHRARMIASGDHPADIGYFSQREVGGSQWPHKTK
jgi:hypothetical protein